MHEQPPDNFWKQYRIVAILLFIFVALVVVTRLPDIYGFFAHIAGNGGFSPWQQVQSSGGAVLQEVLTKDAVIELTNKARADHGLAPLAENQLLNSIAEARARDMLEKQYFAHVSPTGQQASDIAQSVGYAYRIIAENIGSGIFFTNRKIIDGWMQSPGHRQNILSTEVQDIGAAVVRGKMKGMDTYITVQIFGLPSLPVEHKVCVAPPESLLHDINTGKAELNAMQDQLDRLKAELVAQQASIGKDQADVYNDAQNVQKLNERINAFNEKSRWFNKLAAEANGKALVTDAMVREYNKMSQAYNECRGR